MPRQAGASSQGTTNEDNDPRYSVCGWNSNGIPQIFSNVSLYVLVWRTMKEMQIPCFVSLTGHRALSDSDRLEGFKDSFRLSDLVKIPELCHSSCRGGICLEG
jgi:hypothetical protein